VDQRVTLSISEDQGYVSGMHSADGQTNAFV